MVHSGYSLEVGAGSAGFKITTCPLGSPGDLRPDTLKQMVVMWIMGEKPWEALRV